MGIGTYVALVNLASRQKVVVDANGLVRVLLEGEQPKPGEVVLQQPNDDASIEAELVQDDDQSQDLTAELEDIFAALEEGADPTQLGEDFATAAGGQLSSSSTQLGTIERNSAEVVVSTEFSTEGFANLGLSETQSLSLLEQYQLLREGSTAVEVNSSPIGQDLTLTTLEDEELNGRIVATDSDGDSLTYTAGETPTNGSVVVNENGTWTYTPDPDFNGEDSFTVIVSDGKGGTDEITVNVGVTAVNDAPTDLEIDNQTVSENQAGAVIGNLSVKDVDTNDSHTYQVSDERFEVVDGQLKLKDGESLDHETESSVDVTVTATDKGGLTTDQVFTITVGDVNEKPFDLELSASNVAENAAGAVIGNLSVTDVDTNDSHTYQVSDERFEVVDGQLKLKDGESLDHETEASVDVTVTATDKGGLTTDQVFTITVGDVNEKPFDLELSGSSVDENQAGAVIGNLSVTDVDADDSHTYQVSDERFEVVDGQLKLKDGESLDHETESSVDVTVTATDKGGLTTNETFTITVGDVNEKPFNLELSGSSINENQTGAVVGNLSVQDVDTNDSHTYQVSDERFEVVDGQLKLKDGESLDHETESSVDVTVTATDKGGLTTNETFTITVGDVNEKPFNLELSGSSINENQTGAVVGNLSVQDVDTNDSHTYQVSDERFEVVDGQLKLKDGESLDHETEASVDVTVTATDKGGLTTDQVFTITVGDVNEKPFNLELSGSSINENQTGAVVGNLSVQDVDTNDSHTYQVSDERFEVVDGQLKLKDGESLDHETESSVDVTVTATDKGGLTTNETFTITVGDVNEKPFNLELSGSSINENQTGAVVGNLSVQDVDTNDSHTYQVSDERFEVVDGQLKLKDGESLDHETEASVDVTVTATDKGGLTTDQVFTITVGDVNEKPFDLELSATNVAENTAGAVIGNLSVTDVDTDDSHTYQVSDERFEVVDGQLKLKDGESLNHETESSVDVTVTATDKGGLTTDQVFTITVGDVNEKPFDLELSGSSVDENQAGAVIGNLSLTDVDADDSHTYQVSDERFEVVDGQLKLKDGESLNHETESSVDVTVTATDKGGLTTDQVFTITVGDVNEKPFDLELSATNVAENTAGAVIGNLSVTDVDADDSHTYQVSDERFEVVDGQLKLKDGESLDHETEASVDVTVTATDKGGLTTDQVFTITVGDVNEKPFDLELSGSSVDENQAGAVIGNLSVTDVDADDSHTYQVSDERFEVVDGQLKLKDGESLDHETESSVDVTVTATDKGGLTTNETFTITVGDVNEKPFNLELSGSSINENQTGAVVGNLSVQDVDTNDSHTYQVSDERFEVVDGQLKLKDGESLNHETESSVDVTVTATDKGGLTTDQVFTITVGDVNEKPFDLELSGSSVDENQAGAVIGNLSVTDVDADDSHTYQVSDERFEVVDGQLKLKDGESLNHETESSVDVTVTATDKGGLTTDQVFTITVGDVNEKPFDLELSATNVAENTAGAVIGNLSVTDVDTDDSHTYQVSDERFEVVDGQLKLKDGESLDHETEASVDVTVTATDKGGLTTDQVFTITVGDVNEKPFDLELSATNVAENTAGAVIGNLSVTDVDTDDSHTYQVSDERFEVVDGQLKLKDGESLDHETESSVDVTVTATDKGGLTTNETFTITVGDVNEKPFNLELSGSSINENQTGAVVGNLSVQDVDTNDSHTYQVSDERFEVVDGQLKLKDGESLNHETESSVDVTVTATDKGGLTTDQVFTITVGDVNEKPFDLELSGSSVDENQAGAVIGNLSVTDVDADDSHTYQVSDERFEVVDGQLKLKDGESLDHETESSVDVTVTATDKGGLTTNETFTITVGDVNEKPFNLELSGSSINENQTGAVVGNLSVQDVDTNDSHTYQVSDERFEVVDGQLKLKDGESLDHETEASVDVTVTATDKGGLTTDQVFTITVGDVNEKPFDLELSATNVAENTAGAVIGNLSVTDVDTDDSHTYQVSDERFEVVDGQLKLKDGESLNHETESSVDVTVTATDKGGLTTDQVFTITVGDVNEKPFDLELSGSSVDENQAGAVIGNLSLTDVDADDSHTYQVSDERFEVVDGQLKLKDGESLDHETESSVDVTVTATDKGGLTTDQVFTITVGDVNEKPFDLELSATNVAENTAGAVIGNLSVTDVDADDSHTYQVSDERFEVVDGQLKLKDGESLDHETESSVDVTVTATDKGGLTTNETFTITVSDVNEKPFDLELSASNVAENAAGAVIGNLSLTDVDADDSHTYQVSDERFEVVDGQLKLKDGESLDHETESSVDVTVTATDKGGLTTDQVFTITVGDVNEKPFDLELSATNVAENTAGAVIGNLSVTDVDADDSHTYQVSDERFEVVDGQLKLKDGESLDHETESSVDVTVTATDKGGLTTNETFTITVSDVNEKPFDLELSASNVAENAAGAVIGNLSVTDVDADDSHTYQVSDERFEVVDGQLKLKDGESLNHETESSVDVTVTATDKGGLTTDQVFTITVGDVNEKPFDLELSATNVAENTAGAVIGNLSVTDVDADDSHTYQVSDERFEVVDGQLKLKDGESLNHETESSVDVTVTATDKGGLTTDQVFTITVGDVNEKPFDLELSATNVAENTAGAVIGNLSVTDVDADDSHTYQVSDERFEVVDGQLKLKDGESLDHETESSVDVTVTATDKGGLATDQVFTITVGDVNEKPFDLELSGSSVDENQAGAVIGNLSVKDVDTNDSHTYQVSDERFEVVDGQLKLKDGESLNHETESSVDVTVTATDKGGLTTDQVFTITVGDVNEKPFDLELSATNVAENTAGAVIGNLSVTDVDTDDSHTYQVSDERFEVVDGQLKLKDGESLNHETESSVDVTVTATDKGGLTTDQVFTITVGDVNERPFDLELSATNVAENTAGAVIGNLSVTDVDTDDSHTYQVSDERFEVVDGQLKLKDGESLNHETEASVDVTVTATDKGGLTTNETFTITVGDVNEAPIANDDNYTHSHGLTGKFYAYDQNSGNYGNIDSVADAEAIIGSGSPDLTFVSTDLDYRLDSSLTSKENVAEFLGDDASSISGQVPAGTTDGIFQMTGAIYLEAGSFALRVNADDGYMIKIDGNVVAVFDGNQSAHERVGDVFDIDSSGYHTIEIVYWDQGGVAALDIDIGQFDSQGGLVGDFNPLLDAPTLNDELCTVEGQSTTISALSLLSNDTDPEGDALSIQSVTSVTGGTVTLNADGSIEFVPEEGFSGDATFEYVVVDAHGASDTATVTVHVEPISSGLEVAAELVSSSSFVNDYIDTILEQKPTAPTGNGNSGNNVLLGDANSLNDHLSGGSGKDIIFGEASNNQELFGNEGDDILVGGTAASNIVLHGDQHGDGNDVFVSTSIESTTTYYGGGGSNIAYLPINSGDMEFIAGGDNPLAPQADFTFKNNENGAYHDFYNVNTVYFNDGKYEVIDGSLTKVSDFYELNIDVVLNDDDGSEVVTDVVISGVPDGTSLLIGGEVVGTDNGDGTWTLPAELLDADGKLSLTVETPAGSTSAPTFTVTVGAQEVDESGNPVDLPKYAETDTGNVHFPVANPNGDNQVEGGKGDDVVTGDIGGIVTETQAAANYNIALVVDTSGSMDWAISNEQGAVKRIDAVKSALINMLTEMADHSGTINVALIGFDYEATLKFDLDDLSLSDLESSGYDGIDDAIRNLEANGATNYESAFDTTQSWFAAQPSDGFENLTFFLTDGVPTISNSHSNNGSTTELDEFVDSVRAFEELSKVSTVRAIGIGDGIESDVLQFFDNTSANSADFSKTETTLANFNTGYGEAWSLNNWTFGKTGQNDSGVTVVLDKGEIVLTDKGDGLTNYEERDGDSYIQSPEFEVAGGTMVSLNFNLYLGSEYGGGDRHGWIVQKLEGNQWVDIQSSSKYGSVETQALAAGTYRLTVWVHEDHWGYNADIKLDNFVLETVTAPTGVVEIVHGAGELDAALQEASQSIKFAPLGDDVVLGNDGDDILFGDAVNSDNLPWGSINGNPEQPEDWQDGQGLEGVKQFLTLKNHGSEPSQLELYEFIKANHETLNLFDETRGGDDSLSGGRGDDVLYGQGGADTLDGGEGSDTLIGGLGNDILTGGDDADIFKWVDMEHATDTVTDFNVTEGDTLDLSELFVDMKQDDISELLNDLGSGDHQGSAAGVSVSVVDDTSGSSTLTINKDGQTLTVDFDGASAADVTTSLLDNLNQLQLKD